MSLDDDLARVATLAARFAAPGEELAAVLATEPGPSRRVYLCAFANGSDGRTWIALDAAGAPVESRALVREAASIAVLCELAEETAGGGDLQELRARLVSLRLTEGPPGIDEAEEAALALEQVVGSPPRLATPEYLDAVGAASRRLEVALGTDAGGSPFAEALRAATPTVDALTSEVEARYKLGLA